LRERTVLICIFGRCQLASKATFAALVRLWDRRFRAGREKVDPVFCSGRAFLVVDETVEQVCLCAAMSITGSRERQ
jgi:hypothetical protein